MAEYLLAYKEILKKEQNGRICLGIDSGKAINNL